MVFFSINVILHSIFLQGVTSENISTMYCLICPLMSSHYSVFVNVFTCLEEPSHVPISPQSYLQYTHIFLTIRCTPPPPNLGGKQGCILQSECSLPGLLGKGGGGGVGSQEAGTGPHFLLQNFFSYFPPLKPRCVLWSVHHIVQKIWRIYVK